MTRVSYNELSRAYMIMKEALGDELKNPRTYLMWYLDDKPIPLMVDKLWPVGNDHRWDIWPEITGKKLHMLLGPHGHTVIKAWLAKNLL